MARSFIRPYNYKRHFKEPQDIPIGRVGSTGYAPFDNETFEEFIKFRPQKETCDHGYAVDVESLDSSPLKIRKMCLHSTENDHYLFGTLQKIGVVLHDQAISQKLFRNEEEGISFMQLSSFLVLSDKDFKQFQKLLKMHRCDFPSHLKKRLVEEFSERWRYVKSGWRMYRYGLKKHRILYVRPNEEPVESQKYFRKLQKNTPLTPCCDIPVHTHGCDVRPCGLCANNPHKRAYRRPTRSVNC